MHLGVIDVPYGKQPRQKKRGRKLKGRPTMTTGEVADILEAKYHIMEIFYQLKKTQISSALKQSLVKSMEAILTGAPVSMNQFGSASSEIERMFKQFIERGEMERIGYSGVPTKAALKGVNPRLLHPYSKNNPRRPSFIATGQYVDDFKVWVD